VCGDEFEETIQKLENMRTLKLKSLILILITPFLFGACSNKGSSEQKKKFEEAVAFEQLTQSIPSRVSFYMEVITMDPTSEMGKAARERVDQLSRELAALNSTL